MCKRHRLAETCRPRVAQCRAARQHVERGVERPLRIVLVGDRRAEHGQDGVADEFSTKPSWRVIAWASVSNSAFWKARTSSGSSRSESVVKPDEVGEQHGHLPAVGLAVEGLRRCRWHGSNRLDWGRLQGRCSSSARYRPAGTRAPGRPAPRTEREIGLARKTARGAWRRLPAPTRRAEGKAR